MLDAWRNGESIESLRVGDSPIIVADPDWSAGAALIDYQVVEAAQVLGADLRCKVRLRLKTTVGEYDKDAVYAVGTHPVLTVIREND